MKGKHELLAIVALVAVGWASQNAVAHADTLTMSGTASLISPTNNDRYLVGESVTFSSGHTLFFSKYGTDDVNGHSFAGFMKNGYNDGTDHLVGYTCQYTQFWSRYQQGSVTIDSQLVYGTKSFDLTGSYTAFAKTTGAFDGGAQELLQYDYAYFYIDPSD